MDKAFNNSSNPLDVEDYIPGTQFYSLLCFYYICLTLTLFGNVAVLLAIRNRNIQTLAGRSVNALTYIDLGLGIAYMTPLCATFSTPDMEWVFGYAMCILSGILEKSFTFAYSMMMLILAIERMYRLKLKREVQWMAERFDTSILIVTMVSFLVCAFPLLGGDHYYFMKEAHRCVLSKHELCIFVYFVFYILPNAAVVLIWTVSKIKTFISVKNKVSDVFTGVPSDQQFDRSARQSLFTTSINAPSTGWTQAESRKATMLSVIQVPLSCLHFLSSVCFIIHSHSAFNGFSLAIISNILLAVVITAQPFFLFSVSAALRKSFKDAITHKQQESTITPNTCSYGTSVRNLMPREECTQEIPEFLKRPRSAMKIEVRVMPSSDRTNNDLIDSPLKIQERDCSSLPATPTNRHFKFETTIASKSRESCGSSDSMCANAETRSSASSGGITLNVSDLCSRANGRIIRINSELVFDTTSSGIPLSPTSSIGSELSDWKMRKGSLPAPTSRIEIPSPKLRKIRQFKTLLPDKSKLTLQPVEDVSSADSTPKISSDSIQSTITKQDKSKTSDTK